MRNDNRGPWYLITGLVLGIIIGVLVAWVVQPVNYQRIVLQRRR